MVIRTFRRSGLYYSIVWCDLLSRNYDTTECVQSSLKSSRLSHDALGPNRKTTGTYSLRKGPYKGKYKQRASIIFEPHDHDPKVNVMEVIGVRKIVADVMSLFQT